MKKSRNPIYLHLELDTKYCSNEDLHTLKKYACIKYGSTISRDVLVPHDITIRALHYTIMKLFGWMGRHDYTMKLPSQIYDNVTETDSNIIISLMGVLLKCPDEVKIDDDFLVSFDDTGPKDFENRFSEYYTGPYANFASIEDYSTLSGILTLCDSIKDEIMGVDCNKLLGRLKVSSILTYEGDNISGNVEYLKGDSIKEYNMRREHCKECEMQPDVLPLTYKLVYLYDSERKWTVNITMPKDFSVLINDRGVSKEDIDFAKNKVLDSYKPYCIFRDGANVMEDVANLPGFCDFLRVVFERSDTNKKKTALKYARKRDWYPDEIGDCIMF